jgi:hypothetical protein
MSVEGESYQVVRKGRTMVEARSSLRQCNLWWMEAGGEGVPVCRAGRGETRRPLVVGVLLWDDELWRKVMKEHYAGRRPGVMRPQCPGALRIWPWSFGPEVSGSKRRFDATMGTGGADVSLWLHLSPRGFVRLAVGLVEGELERWDGGREEELEEVLEAPSDSENDGLRSKKLPRLITSGKSDAALVRAHLAQGSPLAAATMTPELELVLDDGELAHLEVPIPRLV